MLAWRDVLHEGPLELLPDAELRLRRARFLADLGWGDEAALVAELEQRDELLARAAEQGRPIVLWFEHDLYDQLQLLQILARLEPRRVELVQAGDYLGSLDAPALERLWAERRPVTEAMTELARDAWASVRTREIEPLLGRETAALPYLRPALRRLLEEREPLRRTKRQLLGALAAGPRRPLELFQASQAQEEAVFLGDAWCYLFLHELAADGLVRPVTGELPLPPPRGDHDRFVAARLELTPAGRALV